MFLYKLVCLYYLQTHCYKYKVINTSICRHLTYILVLNTNLQFYYPVNSHKRYSFDYDSGKTVVWRRPNSFAFYLFVHTLVEVTEGSRFKIVTNPLLTVKLISKLYIVLTKWLYVFRFLPIQPTTPAMRLMTFTALILFAPPFRIDKPVIRYNVHFVLNVGEFMRIHVGVL